ncbi:hypothetical protein NDU88_006414, partial [Pleurodeles waltl]
LLLLRDTSCCRLSILRNIRCMSRLVCWNSVLSINAAGVVCVPLVDGSPGAGPVFGGGGAGAGICGPGADEVEGPTTVAVILCATV